MSNETKIVAYIFKDKCNNPVIASVNDGLCEYMSDSNFQAVCSMNIDVWNYRWLKENLTKGR